MIGRSIVALAFVVPGFAAPAVAQAEDLRTKPVIKPNLLPKVAPRVYTTPSLPTCPHVDMQIRQHLVEESTPHPGKFYVKFDTIVVNRGQKPASKGSWKLEVLNGGQLAQAARGQNPKVLSYDLLPGRNWRPDPRVWVHAGEFMGDMTVRVVLAEGATPVDGDCNMGNNSMRISRDQLERELMGR